MKRILHIVGDSKYGGGSYIILRLAQMAKQQGWQPAVLTIDPVFRQVLSERQIPAVPQAFKQVVMEIPQKTVLLVVGGGFLHETLAEQAQHLGLRDHLRLLGLRPDVSEILRAADAYVMSSAWEGMSNALLEAAATALPIVATDVGGNREVVLHGQTGYLVPPRSPDTLARAMLQLMALPESERISMGQAGRAHIVANFDMERIVDRWERLYNQLLELKGFTTWLR